MTFFIRRAGAAAAIVACLACSSGPAAGSSTSTAEPASQSSRIDHILPASDAVVSSPTRFEWTPVEGADSYFLTIVSEVDAPAWETDGLTQPFADVPADVKFDYGTYFWRVVAVKDGKGIAESGRSAFVVLR